MEILGIDVGGSGIKGAPVNVATGKLTGERFRIDTPKPSTPKAVLAAIGEIAKHFKWRGPVGCTFPSVVKDGVIKTAANIDKSWIGVDAAKDLRVGLKLPVTVLNDADAAGIAEMTFGAGKKEQGMVIIVTLGTGIGTAVFHRGMLVPNSELGHLELRGKDAEHFASNRAREKNEMSWKKWAKRVDEYLELLEKYMWPDLFIIGGGVSKEADKFLPLLTLDARVVPAKLLNEAGIVGAALAAYGFHVATEARKKKR